jgi:hypothetical protein
MLKRDKAALIERIVQKAVLAVVVGSLFYDLPYHQSGIIAHLIFN